MRIQHNISAMNSHRNLSINNSSLSKNLEKLSSGYRINRAGDDAAGLAISEKMRAQISGLSQAQNNAADAVSLIQVAEGGLNETHSMLQRMRTLAKQAENGTYTQSDREKITAEVESLKEEITNIAESTTYNEMKLLNASETQSGVAGSFKFAIGAYTETIGVQISSMTAESIGTMNSATGVVTAGSAVSNIKVGTVNDAIVALSIIDDAIETVSIQRSELGAAQNRLEHTINNLAVTEENVQASEARIRDVDMAEEMMAFTKNNILSQAAQSMLAQANMQPQGVLQLLQ